MLRRFPARHAHLLLARDVPFLLPVSLLHNHTRVFVPTNPPKPADELEELPCSKPTTNTAPASSSTAKVSHPWPEWVNLMDALSREGYFDGDGDPFHVNGGALGPKESNSIRTACLNFARDRNHIMGCLSSKHIRVIVECGCPSTDRKVVNSSKRLRAYLGLDESNVCSSCNLRGNCERAFVEAQEGECGRTVDVMRILLTYGLDPVFSTVENKPCLNITVKESVRNLLKQMVEYSTNLPISHSLKPTRVEDPSTNPNSQGKDHTDNPLRQGDWHCPKCNFMNFSRNIKCLRCDEVNEEKLRQIREEQEHLPLKRGDWICDKCSFLNFAKNTRCFQCKAKPPKRQLNPGEWECESCNYLNFRRNAICLKCDHRRPKALNVSNISLRPGDGKERKYEAGDGANSPPSLRRQGLHRGANDWRFVDGEEENEGREQLNSVDELSRFIDFPIAGGKSDLSRDPQKREEWKSKMVERKEIGAGGETKSRDVLQACRIPARPERSECVHEEDDMVDWFGIRDKL
ncbi:hypothetical protein CRG98_024693 [Punica granatum]|uniref:RanBP2-type domain-containing protein n=1 Tax=Punica granatum TaxID=22663 RepID=A0A2I0JF78_PUNGR|nr:hypothetical protein CRG98_024693 [Punica granatum]